MMMLLVTLLLGCRGGDATDAPDGTASDASPSDTFDSAPPFTPSPALRFTGDPPRNVLMISIDTLRADHVLPGSVFDGAPNLQRWQTEGVYTTDAMQCANWTYASTSCTLLGRDPIEHGFLPRLPDELERPYPDGEAFLATVFQEAGFRTAISSRNGFLGPRTNNIQGYDDALTNLRPAQTQLAGMMEHLRQGDDGSPFFAHVHMIEPHDPYDAPEEYEVGRDALDPVRWDFADGSDVNDLRVNSDELEPEELALAQAHARIVYEAEVRWIDDQIEAGLQAWRDRGLLDDTLVVFWSDHGEQLWEHGRYTHAYDLHYGENQALFSLWAVGLEPVRWDGPVSLQDLAPTVLQAMGLDTPPQMTGFPLGEAPPDRLRRAVTADREPQNAMRREELKLVFQWDTSARLLYDRVADPEETTNVFDADNPRHAALWEDLVPYIQTTDAMLPGETVDWAAVGGAAP